MLDCHVGEEVPCTDFAKIAYYGFLESERWKGVRKIERWRRGERVARESECASAQERERERESERESESV